MESPGLRKKIVRRESHPLEHESIHTVLQHVYGARLITSRREVDYQLSNLLPPTDLTGIDDAVDLLQPAVEAGATILFVGDYDADGATSSALGVSALRSMGVETTAYLVPNRFEFGYGLSPEIVRAAARFQPDVVVTVDNGIASIDGVLAAKELGMDVVITDHHLPGEKLPMADAIVNPNLPGCRFGSRALAGVGVIFYVMAALRSRLRASGWFHDSGIAEPNLSDLLDLVALGTVADLVPLDYNNRILVAMGLRRINAGRCRPGIRALLEIGKRRLGDITSADLGYVVGPRLNAAGRLTDMSLGVECLLADDDHSASKLARELDDLNSQRRSIESDMRAQAFEVVAGLHLDGKLPAGLCLYQPDWHQGIVGLIAGRVKDQTGRPTVVFASAGNDQIKGSARSVEKLHIRDLLNDIASQHPDLMLAFGGHAAAAGLSLRSHDYERFKLEFERQVEQTLGADDWVDTLHTDGGLAEQDMAITVAQLLRDGGPWGQGFPEPIFDDRFELIESRVVGDDHLKLRLRKMDGDKVHDAIAFNFAHSYGDLVAGTKIRCVYRLEVNEYRRVRKPQLVVEYIESEHDGG